MALLPAPLRAFHADTSPRLWEGRAAVETGTAPLARLIGWALKLPRAGQDIPATVTIDDESPPGGPSVQRWGRTFAGRSFQSQLVSAGEGLLVERFGPFRFRLNLMAHSDRLEISVSGWDFCGVPLPKALMPRSDAEERIDAEGRFFADIRLTLPWIGLLVHYRVWLEPKQPYPG
ncbi:DUF4166 domain-containing protein [Elstera litoralis]|uniref:DUF4166 domain-containing protein n=1 Tax=Elstera litoralis TaxID=552518 RepID=UPI0018DE86E4|nr:DUF4166 domain-containing protein [Elstera litoralis]